MLLDGKNGIVFGVANQRSIAWSIAKRASDEGARLALTYQGDRLERYVRELAQTLQYPLIISCDVTRDDEIASAFEQVREGFGHIDFLVHSVAFALKDELDGLFMNTSREGYRIAQEVSAFSLAAVSRRAAPLMKQGGSIITLSYLGGERVIPNYNVMGVAKAALEMSVKYLANDLGPSGIRVNAISAGPIRTLAASVVGGLSKVFEHMREHAPLRRNIDQDEVADAALFLLSDMSRGVTGEIIHVDAGYHIMGM